MPVTQTMALNHKHTIKGHSSDVNGVSFSPSSLATCSSDKTVRLWDICGSYTELPSSPLCGHTYSVRAVHFSPDGLTLASCSTDGKIILWDTATGAKKAVLEHKSKSAVRVCRFSPDGKTLATGSDDETFYLWDMEKLSLIRTSERQEESLVALAFSPDSSFLAVSTSSGDIQVWDGKYGHGKQLARQMDAHDLGVTCLDFSPTYGSAGKIDKSSMSQVHFLLASAGFDNNVKLWDILAYVGSTKIQLEPRNTLQGHSADVLVCCFSPSGRILASGSNDKSIRLWDPLKGESIQVIEGHSRYVGALCFSPDGSLLASGSNDREVKIWHVKSDYKKTDLVHVDDSVTLNSEYSREQIMIWTSKQVIEWLRQLNLDGFCEQFRQRNVTGKVLLELNDQILQDVFGMTSLHHRNRLLNSLVQDKKLSSCSNTDDQIPDEFLCPITRELMREPTLASDGYTYERAAIECWFNEGKSLSPMTNAPLLNTTLTPNRSLKMLIQKHIAKKKKVPTATLR